MKLVGILLWLLPFLAHAQKTNNLTDMVAWDPYSLYVNGERVFLYSGEFHYQRLPVPELWLDVFQKFKANGFNSIRSENMTCNHDETLLTSVAYTSSGASTPL